MSTSRFPALRSSVFAAAFVLASAISPPSFAGELVDAAHKAEDLAGAGDVIGAHSVMRAAISAFSEKLPFSIGKAVFVTAEPAGYAMYLEKEDNTFKPGESLVSYVEPIGLNWKDSSTKGKIETHFTVDFDVLDTDGTVLTGQKAFGDFTFTGFFPNQELYATLTVTLTGATPGDYILRYHFNDINNGKTTSVDQPFTIAP